MRKVIKDKRRAERRKKVPVQTHVFKTESGYGSISVVVGKGGRILWSSPVSKALMPFSINLAAQTLDDSAHA